jgi:uncharacterized membrane protein YeaQ/YmgE (transglycosylase-associated protein family)
MSVLGLVLLLLIAAVAGALGQALAGYSLGGCLMSTIVGFIGAFVGLWLARQFGLPELLPVSIEGQTFPVVWAVIGSAFLSAIFGLLFSRPVRYR